VASVCKTVRKDCRDPSLSQSRTATINIPARDHFFWERLFAALQRMEKRGIFQRFDKLKIAGFRFGPVVLTQAGRIRDARYLRRVKVLDMSSPADMALSTGEHGDFSSLVMSMPSIQEVDFSHSCAPVSALRYLTLSCKWLKKLTWEESRCSLTSSLLFAGVCQELKEVYIDGSTLECDDPSEMPSLLVGVDQYERVLERVSIKNCRCQSDTNENETVELSQDALIKFVRETPSLKWLRSDLTPENVAMLKAERPDVTFEG
jgi:hypothetical protein